MKYSQYTSTDFVKDEYFQRWILNPSNEVSNFWEEWLILNPYKVQDVKEAKAMIQDLQLSSDIETNINFIEVWQRISLSKDEYELKTKAKILKVGVNGFLYRAAAVFLILIISLVAYITIVNNNTTTYDTTYGEVKEVTLPDGSIVKLNANSTLKLSQNWEENEVREVWLVGEAFFTVTHKANNQKFTVHTGNINVEVLGTQFNVNHRRGNTKVVLNTGKVRLNTNKTKDKVDLVMKPGELVVFNQNKKQFLKKEVQPELYSSWTDKTLSFNNSSLTEVFEALEDNYGYKIEGLDKKLGNRYLTATIPNGNVDILLKLVSKIFEVQIIKEDRKLTIIEK